MDYTGWPPQFEGGDQDEFRALQMAGKVSALKIMIETQRETYRAAWTLQGEAA